LLEQYRALHEAGDTSPRHVSAPGIVQVTILGKARLQRERLLRAERRRSIVYRIFKRPETQRLR
jgi:hypothetical protein